MPVSDCAAYAIYPESIALSEVLHSLRQGGFDKESICMMLSPAHPIATTVRDASKAACEQEDNVSAGLIGWLSELGAVLIPTVCFFIRSRAFFHALIVEQQSLVPHDRCRTLAGLGFSDEDAKRLEDQVREVGVLLYVACSEDAQSQWALELLRGTGAEESGLLRSRDALLEVAALAN